jgi:nucleoside-diphosphate-sugar epimerase
LTNVLVTGAGGFIGGHLVAALRQRSDVSSVRGVDRVPVDQWHQRFDDVDSRCADLQLLEACQASCEGIDVVYNLAADMGGRGAHR